MPGADIRPLVHIRPIRMNQANGADVHEKQMVRCSDRAFFECAAALCFPRFAQGAHLRLLAGH